MSHNYKLTTSVYPAWECYPWRTTVNAVHTFTFREYQMAIGPYPLSCCRARSYPGANEARGALAAELWRLRRDGCDWREVRRRILFIFEHDDGGGRAERIDIEAELAQMA